ncbi:MAG: conserved rane protein of unknown function (modular protein) [Deltaproteobacteria bacterium]|nr:conserved rane protein of unknown function (modular protein) [Deltaproteobacteria bacterium]
MLEQQVKKADMRAGFTEYAWDMNWNETPPDLIPGRGRRPIMPPMGGARDIFVTRMHVGYDAQHFPEDLLLQETADRSNFQARYVLRQPWKGEESSCPATDEYRRQITQRQQNEARQLADLTGWQLADIRSQMNLRTANAGDGKWWQKLWTC